MQTAWTAFQQARSELAGYIPNENVPYSADVAKASADGQAALKKWTTGSTAARAKQSAASAQTMVRQLGTKRGVAPIASFGPQRLTLGSPALAYPTAK